MGELNILNGFLQCPDNNYLTKMLDKSLRQFKERVLHPMAERLPVSPTVLTLAGLGAGLLTAGAAYTGATPLALVLWGVNRLLDGLDGTVARLHDKQTDLGAYIDILADFTVYALIPAALVAGLGTGYGALVFLLVTFYINAASWMYLSALLEKRRQGAAAQDEMTSATMPGGIIEGTETVLFYTAFLLFPAQVDLLFTAMGVLVAMTIMQRLLWAMRHLDG